MTKNTAHFAAILASVSLSLSFCFCPRPAEAGDPDIVFKTLESEHFRVHYESQLEALARRSLSILEESYSTLTFDFGWAVPQQIEVILTDDTDSSNGSALVMPRPEIRLYAVPPTLDTSLQQTDDWLRMLIIHELTHVVSLQIHGGVSRVINAIFGDVYLPNQLTPRWFYEGIAVVSETIHTSAGRIRSAEFAMTVRTDMLEGRFLELDDLSNPRNAYPRGGADYIYGALFMDFVYRRFGMEKIGDILRIYGRAPLPYGLNRAFKRALGKDLESLYSDWKQEVAAQTQRISIELRAVGLSTSRRWTDNGESKGGPLFLADGSLIVPMSDGSDFAGLYRISRSGQSIVRVCDAGSGSDLSADRSGRIFFTRTAPFKSDYYYLDLFVLEPGVDRPRRLTHGLRVRAVSARSDGSELALVRSVAGKTKLVVADDRGHVQRVLFEADEDSQIFSPAWSPDGKWIAAALRRGPQPDLVLIDSQSGAMTMLTHDRFIEGPPSFDATGDYVVFSSDRTGISNLYSLRLSDRAVTQLTNVLTGAELPAISPDGSSMAFLEYSSQGWNLHVAPFSPQTALAPLPSAPLLPPAPPFTPPMLAPVPRAYNPLPSFLPRFYRVLVSGGANGGVLTSITTSARDAVGRHNATAQFDYDFGVMSASGGLSYYYGGLVPGLGLSYSRTVNPRQSGYAVGGVDRRWHEVINRGSGSLSIPFLGEADRHSVSVGYAVVQANPLHEPKFPLDPEGPLPTVPKSYFRAGLELNWSYNKTVMSPFGVSPHKGRDVSAGVALYHPALGGRDKLLTIRGGWTEYFAMPWLKYHVLALRGSFGVQVTDPPHGASFSMGGYDKQNLLEALWTGAAASVPGLRGYPVGAFDGDRYFTARAEYRFPLWYASVGYRTLPLFLKQVQANLITDNAVIAFEPLGLEHLRSGLGAEITWVVAIGYHQVVTIRTGYAYGLMPGGGHEIIFVMGNSY
ncbi:MAG: BamA/TamA family outer membrane protein [Myxococcota bacterium]|nr:BamA/TamA family outer membrane protein [Myxococcota bacterium]